MTHKLRLITHLEYINRRKAELEKEDKHKVISLLIIKELEVKEYEFEEEDKEHERE